MVSNRTVFTPYYLLCFCLHLLLVIRSGKSVHLGSGQGLGMRLGTVHITGDAISLSRCSSSGARLEEGGCVRGIARFVGSALNKIRLPPNFLAGGIAGTVASTLTAPLEVQKAVAFNNQALKMHISQAMTILAYYLILNYIY